MHAVRLPLVCVEGGVIVIGHSAPLGPARERSRLEVRHDEVGPQGGRVGEAPGASVAVVRLVPLLRVQHEHVATHRVHRAQGLAAVVADGRRLVVPGVVLYSSRYTVVRR